MRRHAVALNRKVITQAIIITTTTKTTEEKAIQREFFS